jgi:hypothetical protein
MAPEATATPEPPATTASDPPEPEPVPWLPAVGRVMSVGLRTAAGGDQRDRTGSAGGSVGMELHRFSAHCPSVTSLG